MPLSRVERGRGTIWSLAKCWGNLATEKLWMEFSVQGFSARSRTIGQSTKRANKQMGWRRFCTNAAFCAELKESGVSAEKVEHPNFASPHLGARNSSLWLTRYLGSKRQVLGSAPFGGMVLKPKWELPSCDELVTAHSDFGVL